MPHEQRKVHAEKVTTLSLFIFLDIHISQTLTVFSRSQKHFGWPLGVMTMRLMAYHQVKRVKSSFVSHVLLDYKICGHIGYVESSHVKL